jgi:hypothetical protein
MLSMAQIESCIHLVQDVHRCRLELQQRHDKRQCNEGSVVDIIPSARTQVYENADLTVVLQTVRLKTVSTLALV